VATIRANGLHIIAAGEVEAFTVCPYAWKLRSIDREDAQTDTELGQTQLGQELHRSWSALFEESLFLLRWFRYLAVLACVATFSFLQTHPTGEPLHKLFGLSVGNQALQLLVLVVVTLLVMTSFGRAAEKKQVSSGFGAKAVAISVEGSKLLPPKEYVSLTQGLAGKPDALIEEDGLIIPVERKPLARKLRDRYVAQLLVYMRLVEEFEGKRPTHGYLLMGEPCVRVRVDNKEAKQRWVSKMVADMRGILDGRDAKPSPHPQKCAKCNVKHRCSFKVDPAVSA
jgi:CRISPR/Cas system-associated exonuclease Cas4 (RecB family)